MAKRTAWIQIIFVLFGASLAWGDVTVAPVFSEGMVLQANLACPIFGSADPGERVVVECRGLSWETAANPEGRWLARMTPAAPGGPHSLTIRGKNTLLLKNVLFGEVWVASGQSNMQFPLKRAEGAAPEIARASHPGLRYFRSGSQKWDECTPETAGTFSAMAYYFARELMGRIRTPVGILDLSVDGAVAQTFVSEESLKETPEFARKLARQTDQKVSENHRLHFKPVLPYAIRGAIWCQGEGNRGCPATYKTLLPFLVADWRRQWGQGDFPFLIVQLVNSQDRRDEPWEGRDCAIREAQLQTSGSVPNTALVVTIDLGVKDVHYPKKRPAGERLALAARALAYGEKIEYSGPLYESAKFSDGTCILSFTHLGSGLLPPGDRLTGFLLSGKDGRFSRAEAKIEGDHVIVWSPKIADPAAVRYAWERNPACNLSNREGLPASPFRSDGFDSPYFQDETK
jgi:sialate O-acetylesterase